MKSHDCYSSVSSCSVTPFQLLIPCIVIDGSTCTCNDADAYGVFPGRSDVIYNVSIHVRGKVERKTYTGGVGVDRFQTGGEPGNTNGNIFGLEVGNPAQTYYLNRNITSPTFEGLVEAIDYEAEIQIRGRSCFRMFARGVDGQSQNINNLLSVPGIDSPAQPYSGLFVQLDLACDELFPLP